MLFKLRKEGIHMIIEIKKLIDSLKQVDWNYDFKITKHKDGSGTLSIPDFIMSDLSWAIEEGRPTPRSQVYAGSDCGESENCYWEWDTQGNQLANIHGDYFYEGRKVDVIKNGNGEIVDFVEAV